jgi:hypothetical protein
MTPRITVTVDARAVEAAAQALCAWPSVAVDDREHDTATNMAIDALTAAARAQPQDPIPTMPRAELALFVVWSGLAVRALARRSPPAAAAFFAFAAGERWRGAAPLAAAAARRRR